MGDHPIRATRSEPETGRCRGPDEAARRAADIVGRLSDASRWLQFLGTKKELSPRTAGAELVRCGHGTAEYEITLTPAAVGMR